MSIPGWELTEIQDFFTVVGGGTPSRKKERFWEGHVPWISSADIHPNHTVTPRRKITEEAIQSSATNLVPKGSLIVVTRVGLGKVCVAPTDMCFSQDCQALLPTVSGLSTKYFLHQIGWVAKNFIAQARGTTISGITKKQLVQTEIQIPPLPEQNRIVGAIETYFSRLDKAVEALERVKANLKRYRASVLKSAVEGRLVPTEAELAKAEGRSFEPASELLERILKKRRVRWEEAELAKLTAKGKTPKNDKWKAKYKVPAAPDTEGLPELPEGWCWATVEQLGEQRLGKMLDKDKNKGTLRPYLRNANVRWFQFDLSDLLEMKVTDEELKQVSVKTGDLVICEGGEPGRAAVWEDAKQPFVIQKALHKVSPYSGVDSWYLAYFLAAEAGSGKLERAFTGSTIKHFTGQSLRSYLVPLPPQTEQIRIVEAVEHSLSIIEKVEDTTTSNLQRTTRLRQAILKWAFEGKLADQNPNDEPAAELLERIRQEREAMKPVKKAKRRGRKAKGNG